MYSRILLAADNATTSLHAAREAGNLARALNASRFCLAVFHPPVPHFLGEPQFDKVAAARTLESEAAAKALGEEVGALPCAVELEILEGPTAQAVSRLCETHEVDLIVMGASSMGAFGHLLQGEPSQKVVNHVDCPVLIVR